MATHQKKPVRETGHLPSSPPKKKSKEGHNMKDDARDSLVEFQSSIFDASDGHQLVDFIRKKKGLRSQPQKIFDDVRTDRQSLQIEIQRLNENENTLRPEEAAELVPGEAVDNEVQSTSANNGKPDSPTCSRRQLTKSPALKLKRLSHSIGRRTLLKEFERTLQESRFLPPTCSTPLTVNLANVNATPINTETEKALSKATSMTQEKSLDLNLVCTPITITDEESPLPAMPQDPSEANRTRTPASNNTEDVMRDLQEQNDFLLQMAKSDDDNVNRSQIPSTGHDKENPVNRRPSNIGTPTKKTHRETYTVHRDSTSGKLILSPSKTREEGQLLPKSPLRNLEINTKRLVVTPEQKRLLLNKYGRNLPSSPMKVASVQKTSRIPVIAKGTIASAPSRECQDVERANVTYQIAEHGETAQIIEQLQKSTPSNAPVIVIPVNQTFNQAPGDTSRTAAKAPLFANSPNSNEISSTTTTNVPQPEAVATPRSNNDCSMNVNSLRLADIITEDDSSSSDDNQPLIRSRILKKRQKRKSSKSTAKQISNRYESELGLSVPTARSSSHHIRELITPHQLSEMSVGEILDLRKRNSRGELRKTLLLSERESSMFDKQVELELLRRNIQEKNYEDEVLQMEVLPPPPEEFCDKRKSLKLSKSLHVEAAAPVTDNFVDESSSDRISLSQEPQKKFPSSNTGRMPRKNKKISEQLEKYLKASELVPKSKYLNMSKRTLYSKGNSELSSSDDSSPQTTPSYRSVKSPRKMPQTPMEPDEHVQVTNNESVRIPIAPPSSPPSPPSPPRHLSPLQHISPPANPVNISIEKTQFLPNDKHIFKKPVGRPPKKAKTTQNSQSTSRSRSPAVKKGKKNRKNSQSSSSSPAPVDPVISLISDNDENSTVRRSKRERKPRSAYWSCSQKEYYPFYDLGSLLATKRNPSIIKQKAMTNKKAKNLPSSENNLVANTKTISSRSVDKAQGKKNSNKKQQQKTEPKFAKRKEKKSKESTDDTNSSNAPRSAAISEDSPPAMTNQNANGSDDSENLSSAPTRSRSRRVTSRDGAISQLQSEYPSEDLPCHSGTITEDTRPDRLHPNNLTNLEKSSKSKNRQQSNSRRASLTDGTTSPSLSECLSQDLPGALATITEDTELDRHQSKRVDTLKKTSKSKSKKRQPLIDERDDNSQFQNITKNSISNIDKTTTSKSKGAKSKKIQSSTNSLATFSDCPSEEYPSSIQQIRLTTIVEDSVPGLSQHVTISVSDFDKTRNNRLSTELMPPPASRGIQKKSKFSKKAKQNAFRTEHDESIADASSVHVNKLFDQLKSSSMCVTDDDAAQQVTNIGQVLQSSREKEHNSKSTKCRNLTVRLLRMKGKKTSPKGNEKVCDSGFSSEDMSSDPKQRGDILLNWLKQIVRNGKSPSGSQKGVAKILQSDGFHAASVDDLMFQEIDGVEYAFYNTKKQFSFGYMRFNPRTEKKRCTAKKFELNFVVLCGEVQITANANTFDCKNGDLITVFIGTSYGIKNISNDPALVMVIKN